MRSSSDERRHGPPRHASREEAAAQECPLEAPLPVETTPTKSRNVPRREHVWQRLPITRQHAPGQICFKPAERLARHDVQSDRHEPRSRPRRSALVTVRSLFLIVVTYAAEPNFPRQK
jgi:hypothetical protein